jgi:hypothetical protein
MNLFRDIDRARRPLWDTGDRIGYAFDHLEDADDPASAAADLLDTLARWISTVDFASLYVDLRTPYGGNPRCHGLARRAWAMVLLSFHLIEHRLRRFQSTIPIGHPFQQRAAFLYEQLEGLHVDLVWWITDDGRDEEEEQPEHPHGLRYDA